jgi:hypothetical protein
VRSRDRASRPSGSRDASWSTNEEDGTWWEWFEDSEAGPNILTRGEVIFEMISNADLRKASSRNSDDSRASSAAWPRSSTGSGVRELDRGNAYFSYGAYSYWSSASIPYSSTMPSSGEGCSMLSSGEGCSVPQISSIFRAL